jgi:hypothetical protein
MKDQNKTFFSKSIFFLALGILVFGSIAALAAVTVFRSSVEISGRFLPYFLITSIGILVAGFVCLRIYLAAILPPKPYPHKVSIYQRQVSPNPLFELVLDDGLKVSADNPKGSPSVSITVPGEGIAFKPGENVEVMFRY